MKGGEETCKRVKEKGVEIFEGPKKMPWEQTVAYFKDPDGNILEISSK
ncbi:MAG: VOC family protein [Candidatus Roizmanbacteria bacterium]|nr:VOC family protein [Candidatus Roizmanbacteria bacterium]